MADDFTSRLNVNSVPTATQRITPCTYSIFYLISQVNNFCLIHFILFAPADTIKRPLTNKRKRIIRKLLTIMIGLIYTFIIVFSHNEWISKILLAAMMIEAINIHPLLYKVFGQPYGNYKKIKH